MQRTCVTLLVAVFTVAVSAAQENQTFSARANLVRVPTLVRDASGNVVFGLHASDFVIEDDGVAQPVNLDEALEAQPVSLMIAIQCGRRASREFERMAGLSAMLDPILSDRENEAAVLFFDSKLNLLRDFTSNSEDIETGLQKMPHGDGGAAVLDAIAYSARLLSRRDPQRKRVLLLISETRDHGSKFTKLDDALMEIDRNDVSVFALTFSPYVSQQLDDLRGSNKDEWGPSIDVLARVNEIHQAMRKNVPQTLASITGGEYARFSTQNTFESRLIDFANHLHNRYELSFQPKDPHSGLHHIRVRLSEKTKSVSLSYRTTYLVASP